MAQLFSLGGIAHMRFKIYGVFMTVLGVFLLLSGLGLCYFKMTGQHFPDALVGWLWGTINYSQPYGTINILVEVILGIGLIRAGLRYCRSSR